MDSSSVASNSAIGEAGANIGLAGGRGGNGGNGGGFSGPASGFGGNGGTGGHGGVGANGGNGGNALGGGLYLLGSTFNLLNSTVAYNSLTGGAGGRGGDGGQAGDGGNGGGYGAGSAIDNIVGGNGGNGGNAQGGGVYQSGGSLTISASVLTSNVANPGNGGAGGNGGTGGTGGHGGNAGVLTTNTGTAAVGGNGGNGGNNGNGGLAVGGGLYLTGGVVALVTTNTSITANTVGNSVTSIQGFGGPPGVKGRGGPARIPGKDGKDGKTGGNSGNVGLGHQGQDPDIFGSVTSITTTPLLALLPSTLNALQGISTGSVLLATFTQGESTQADSAYTAAANWGDGSSDTSTEAKSPLTIVASGQTIFVYGAHTYAANGKENLSVMLSTSGSSATANPTATVAGPSAVSSDVSVTRSGFRYDFVHHVFVQTITITNTSGSDLTGPLTVVLTNLSSNATLTNATGKESNGDPYIDVSLPNNELAAGASIAITLYFSDPAFKAITYSTQVQAESSC